MAGQGRAVQVDLRSSQLTPRLVSGTCSSKTLLAAFNCNLRLSTQNPTLRSELIIATKMCGYNPGSTTAGNRQVPPLQTPADCRLDAASVGLCRLTPRRPHVDPKLTLHAFNTGD